jgi:hypothetical protein
MGTHWELEGNMFGTKEMKKILPLIGEYLPYIL